MERVAIIGDGQMGLVAADVLAARGTPARLWGRRPDAARELARTRRSPHLADFTLPEAIEVTGDDAGVFEAVTIIASAVPAQYIRPVWTRLRPHVPAGVPVISFAKGVENETLLRPTQIVAEALGEDIERPDRALGALSGPTIAAEVARHLPATMVAASADAELARRAQTLFTAPWQRIYRLDDLVGVEIAGATKNVIALAAGMIDGLEAGYNAKSALLARGLAEIARLGAAMGASLDTFFGVAGVGDLAVTCFSPLGRNRTCGERLGRGEGLAEIVSSTVSVVEGVATTRSIVALARRHGVEMPITVAVHAILFEGLDPRDAIATLMTREPKAERIL